MEGSLSNEGAPALIDRAKLDFRDMREVGGFVIRSDASHSNGSARFARSLTERQPRMKTYRAIQNIRDMGGRG